MPLIRRGRSALLWLSLAACLAGQTWAADSRNIRRPPTPGRNPVARTGPAPRVPRVSLPNTGLRAASGSNERVPWGLPGRRPGQAAGRVESGVVVGAQGSESAPRLPVSGLDYDALVRMPQPWPAETAPMDGLSHFYDGVRADVPAAVPAGVEKSLKAVGTDLQAWGLHKVLVDDGITRYARLYRLDGMPTDLGLLLHEALAPLIRKDPKLLARLSDSQIEEAVHIFLTETQSARLRPDDYEMNYIVRRSIEPMWESGFDYPDDRRRAMAKARRALERRQESAESAELKFMTAERHPAEVLSRMLETSQAEFDSLRKNGVPTSADEARLAKLGTLIDALHGAMGRPMAAGPGRYRMVSLQHRMLLPILEELNGREAPEEVVSAVIRSFPLGESILRLGVHHLWAMGVTGAGLVMAVIDSGVDSRHPDLAGAVTRMENLTKDREDHAQGWHATAVASVISALAPGVEIHSYKVLPDPDEASGVIPGTHMSELESREAMIAALETAAAQGARIINISGGFGAAYRHDSVALKVAELAQRGVLVIAAAGNSGKAMPDGLQLFSPALSEGAIAAGSMHFNGGKAGDSAAGAVLDPAKPGGSFEPEIFYAFGEGIKAAAYMPRKGYLREPAPFLTKRGTSFAAPHISALAALMLDAAGESLDRLPVPMLAQVFREALRTASEKDRQGWPTVPMLKVTDAVKAVEEFVKAVQKGSA